MERRYKIVVYVPESHADQLRESMGNAGAGVIGNYTHCMFSMFGVGQSMPKEGSDPFYGEVGELNEAEEVRIETVCEGERLQAVVDAIRGTHPYDEPAFDVYPIELIT